MKFLVWSCILIGAKGSSLRGNSEKEFEVSPHIQSVIRKYAQEKSDRESTFLSEAVDKFSQQEKKDMTSRLLRAYGRRLEETNLPESSPDSAIEPSPSIFLPYIGMTDEQAADLKRIAEIAPPQKAIFYETILSVRHRAEELGKRKFALKDEKHQLIEDFGFSNDDIIRIEEYAETVSEKEREFLHELIKEHHAIEAGRLQQHLERRLRSLLSEPITPETVATATLANIVQSLHESQLRKADPMPIRHEPELIRHGGAEAEPELIRHGGAEAEPELIRHGGAEAEPEIIRHGEAEAEPELIRHGVAEAEPELIRHGGAEPELIRHGGAEPELQRQLLETRERKFVFKAPDERAGELIHRFVFNDKIILDIEEYAETANKSEREFLEKLLREHYQIEAEIEDEKEAKGGSRILGELNVPDISQKFQEIVEYMKSAPKTEVDFLWDLLERDHKRQELGKRKFALKTGGIITGYDFDEDYIAAINVFRQHCSQAESDFLGEIIKEHEAIEESNREWEEKKAEAAVSPEEPALEVLPEN